MSDVSPREVLARVSAAIPAACRDKIVIVGSLAAGYHLLRDRAEAQVRTKDVDCLLYPRVEAVRAGGEVAGQLLDAGWHPKAEGKHAQPGTESTPEDSLPAVRLYPPASQEWFLELLAAHERGDAADKRWMRLRLPAGHFGLPSYRFLDLAIHQAPMTDLGLRSCPPRNARAFEPSQKPGDPARHHGRPRRGANDQTQQQGSRARGRHCSALGPGRPT